MATADIETERLLLRHFMEADWDALKAILTDPEVNRYTHFALYPHDRLRRWFEECLAERQAEPKDDYNRVITLHDTGEVAGWFGIGGAIHGTEPGERSCGFVLAFALLEPMAT
jgi:RimJ/RimL family protein N-acetyltransferase